MRAAALRLSWSDGCSKVAASTSCCGQEPQPPLCRFRMTRSSLATPLFRRWRDAESAACSAEACVFDSARVPTISGGTGAEVRAEAFRLRKHAQLAFEVFLSDAAGLVAGPVHPPSAALRPSAFSPGALAAFATYLESIEAASPLSPLPAPARAKRPSTRDE